MSFCGKKRKDRCIGLKDTPYTLATIPGPVDDLIKPFILGEMVRIGGEVFETAVTFCNAVKEINGKEASFGLYGGEDISVFLPHIFSLSISPQARRTRRTHELESGSSDLSNGFSSGINGGRLL